MGKSTTNQGQDDLSQAQKPHVAMTSEATNVTNLEKKVCLGDQPHHAENLNKTKGVLIVGIVEDYEMVVMVLIHLWDPTSPRGVILICIFPSLPSTRPFGSSLASGSVGTPKLSE